MKAWAAAASRDLLEPLGDRWRHTIAVARRAREVSSILPAAQQDVLVAGAYLHDVGYAPTLAVTGFHPLDGALFVRRHLRGELAALVAHHSGARFEASLRGLERPLAAFGPVDRDLADALTYCDLTTGPKGERVHVQHRLAEIVGRYRPDSLVARAVQLAEPELMAAVERTEQRLQLLALSEPRRDVLRGSHRP